VSERRACRTLGQHRSTRRKQPSGRGDEDLLVADMVELARQYGRYGYRRIAADSGPVEGRRLVGQRWSDRKALATRGAKGTLKTAEETSALAE